MRQEYFAFGILGAFVGAFIMGMAIISTPEKCKADVIVKEPSIEQIKAAAKLMDLEPEIIKIPVWIDSECDCSPEFEQGRVQGWNESLVADSMYSDRIDPIEEKCKGLCPVRIRRR